MPIRTGEIHIRMVNLMIPKIKLIAFILALIFFVSCSSSRYELKESGKGGFLRLDKKTGEVAILSNGGLHRLKSVEEVEAEKKQAEIEKEKVEKFIKMGLKAAIREPSFYDLSLEQQRDVVWGSQEGINLTESTVNKLLAMGAEKFAVSKVQE